MVELYRPQGRLQSLKHIQPRKCGVIADGDVVNVTEAYTKGLFWRDSGGAVGVRGRGMYGEEYQELGIP